MNEPVCVVETNCLLGESPLWSARENALYWVDIRNPMIHRYTPATKAHEKWPVETEIGSIGFAKDGKFIAGLRSGFVIYDLDDNSFEAIIDPEGKGRLNPCRLNDGKADRAGRYWSGTMEDPGHGPIGKLYRLTPDGTCDEIENGIQVPNAICWSPDDKTMYFADSYQGCIWAHDFDLESGTMANRRVFAELPDGTGSPDGATVDAEGFVWNANMFGGRVTRYDPDGKVERVIEFPVPQITCCAFGGPDMETLYVTTGSVRMTKEDLVEQPLAGALFAVDVGVKGLPEPQFGG